MAAQKRKTNVLKGPGVGQTPPPFRVTSKRGPAEKATPATNATPTPTPGMKHRKNEDSDMLQSSKKALFVDGGEDDEKSSFASINVACVQALKMLLFPASSILGLGSTATPGQGPGRKHTNICILLEPDWNNPCWMPPPLRNGCDVDFLRAQVRDNSALGTRNFV